MKQTDIKRLEKAVEHLQKAEDLLSKTYDSLVDQPTQLWHIRIAKYIVVHGRRYVRRCSLLEGLHLRKNQSIQRRIPKLVERWKRQV